MNPEKLLASLGENQQAANAQVINQGEPMPCCGGKTQHEAGCPFSTPFQRKQRRYVASEREVLAILNGKQVQLRQLVRPFHPAGSHSPWKHYQSATWGWKQGRAGVCYLDDERLCPFGQEGDRVWVAESWARIEPHPSGSGDDHLPDLPYEKMSPEVKAYWARRVAYRATMTKDQAEASTDGSLVWRSATQMQRWASRIILEVEKVWVERVQDLSEEDAEALGFEPNKESCDQSQCRIHPRFPEMDGVCVGPGYRSAFAAQWIKKHGVHGNHGACWLLNPWVWAVKFKLVKSEEQNHGQV